MQHDRRPSPPWLRRLLSYIVFTPLFSIAYTQSPLYTSNQNQYFLHGLARAGLGYLREDWLANTLDPTPLFSLLVFLSYRYLRLEALFYIYYAILMGVYLVSLLEISAAGFTTESHDHGNPSTRYIVLVALLIVIHSAGLRFGLSRLVGVNWTYALEDGVADQRLLGPVFQPSSFGVLLVLSLALFHNRRPYLAVLSAVSAAVFHPTYLLSAGALTLGYLLFTWIESRDPLGTLRLGGLALAAALPVLVYVYAGFGPPYSPLAQQSRQVLVQVRIPHHALPSYWFDLTVVFKLVLVLAGIFMVRRSRLFWVLVPAFGIALALTLIQVFTGSTALALLFPWRISTFLVPVCVAFLLAGASNWFSGLVQGQVSHLRLRATSLAFITLAVVVGGIRFTVDLERKANLAERGLEQYVFAHKTSRQIYLIPTKMQDFRLASGSPIFVDFKSIPYRDRDVLEWHRRLRLADRFYRTLDCATLHELISSYRLTHLVLAEENGDPDCGLDQPIYQDQFYRLYALASP